MKPGWPSNDYTVQIEKANGRKYTWRHNDPNLEKRPTVESYGTKFMEGYADAQVVLARKEAIGPDLGKYDTLRIWDVYGVMVYEGRITDATVDTDRQRLTVTAAGWMTHARDQPMTPVLYVDSDRSRWSGATQTRRNQMQTANFPIHSDPETLPNSEGGALRLTVEEPWVAPVIPTAEALYDAGPGVKVGRIYLTWIGTGASGAGWIAEVFNSVSDAVVGVFETTGDFYTTEVGTLEKDFANAYRFITINFRFNATPGGIDGDIDVLDLKPTLYGDHGLTRYGSAPGGLLVSDIIKHSAAIFTPKLDTSEIAASTHIVDQCAEQETQDPYDFWLKLNKYENRHLAVWGGRKLRFDELDYDTVDWRVRDGRDGVVVKWTGASTVADFNGIVVQYESTETGRIEILVPTDDARLTDANPAIAANKAGIAAYAEVKLTKPDSREGAIRTAQLILERLNRGKAPGTIVVRGAIRNGAHHWRPLGHPKSGQTILVENAGGTPRMITETKVTEPETLTITIDGKAETTDAILDELYTEANLRRRA